MSSFLSVSLALALPSGKQLLKFPGCMSKLYRRYAKPNVFLEKTLAPEWRK